MLREFSGEMLMGSTSSAAPVLQTEAPTPRQVNAALLLIRIASAAAFLYHGSAILFGAFGGPGPREFSSIMHMPPIDFIERAPQRYVRLHSSPGVYA